MLLVGLNVVIRTNVSTASKTSASFHSIKNMIDIFRSLKSLVKVNHIKTDSIIFRLHYSLTVIVLLAFSLIVTTRQYVGNPIDCIHTKDIPEDVLNTFCWIHSTYTMKHLFHKKVGEEVAYPGVGNSQMEKLVNGKAERKTYRYYQWVCFCLFFQVKFKKKKYNVYIYSDCDSCFASECLFDRNHSSSSLAVHTNNVAMCLYRNDRNGIIILYFMWTIKAQKCANKNEKILQERIICLVCSVWRNDWRDYPIKRQSEWMRQAFSPLFSLNRFGRNTFFFWLHPRMM